MITPQYTLVTSLARVSIVHGQNSERSLVVGKRSYFAPPARTLLSHRGRRATTMMRHSNRMPKKIPTGEFVSVCMPPAFIPGMSSRRGTTSGAEPIRNCSCRTFVYARAIWKSPNALGCRPSIPAGQASTWPSWPNAESATEQRCVLFLCVFLLGWW